jgi:predicted PurR-regulated permease PerM
MEKDEKKQTIRQQLKSGSDWNIRPYLAMGLTFFIVFCCCILVVCVLFRFQDIKAMSSMMAAIAQPILYGLAIGYLINPIMMFFERLLLKAADARGVKKKWKRLIRTVSSILAVLVFLLIIVMLLSMVIPEVSANISNLVDTMPAQINSFIVHLNEWEYGNREITAILEEYLVTAADWIEDWLKNSLLPQTKDYVATVTSGLINVLNAFKNIVIGLIVSIYVMCEKENFEGQAKKIIFALFPARAANQVIQVFHTTNEIFGGFIKGKLLDSLIIGILCYIVLCIIRMPYTLLVSVIVGVTNIIPFFGPFIGAIPSTFLILLVDPLYAVYFVIFVVILQQIDGNIIGPKILGDSTGLSSFWVMFAILVGSGLFGVMGMLLGCPVFAVIYDMIRRLVMLGLKKHGKTELLQVHAQERQDAGSIPE